MGNNSNFIFTNVCRLCKSLVYCVKQQEQMLFLSSTTAPQSSFYLVRICYLFWYIISANSIMLGKGISEKYGIVCSFQIIRRGWFSIVFIYRTQKDSYFEDKVKHPVCCSLTVLSSTVGTHTPGPTGRLWLEQMRRQSQTLTADLESVFSVKPRCWQTRDLQLKTIRDPLPSRKSSIDNDTHFDPKIH